MPSKAVYVQGSIKGTMIRTAFAMLAGTIAISGYNIADTYFVGRLPGAIPMAAIGYTFPIIMLLVGVFHGLGTGIMTTAATALGAGRREKATLLITSGLLLTTIVSIALAVAGILTSSWALRQQGATGEALQEAQAYLNIWFFGCLTASLSQCGNDLLVGAGDSKLAAFGMFFGLVLNIILDPICIFGWGPIPRMEIRGAAWATIFSQAISTVYVLTVLNRRHHLLRFALYPVRLVHIAWAKIIRFAVPSTLGMLMMPIGSFVVTRVTATFGDVAVAAAQAAGKLEAIAFMFPMSFGISLIPMISQNFGARRYDRIRECRRFSMSFAFCFLAVMAVLFFLFAPSMVGWFTTDPEVKRLMILYMSIIPWGFWGQEVHRFGGFCFMGCGHPKAAAWLNAYRVLGLLIPFSLAALFFFHSLTAVFLARMLSDAISGGTAFLLARRLTNRLADTMPATPAA